MRTHQIGDRGDDVGLLQRRLVRAGYPLDITHVYDAATEAAVKALQMKYGLVVDGIAGPKTQAAILSGTRPTAHLSDADLVRAAAALGVELACVRAVNEVESEGSGFLPSGRPVILFERHIFWQRLTDRGIDPSAIAAKYPDICNQSPGGYKGGEFEYIRLDKAEMIDPDAAYEATTWGLFQIMGEHALRLGYPTIDDFVGCMEKSEADQLDAFVRFLKADAGLLASLKGKRWAAFARGYNGPNYARNLYDVKLARAYEKYSTDQVAA